MHTKLMNIICGGLIAGFLGLCVYGKQSSKAILTSAEMNAAPQKPVVVIDAGHGGADGGCISVDGTAEKGINLNISLTLRDCLSACGFSVDMTRDSDKSIHDSNVNGLAAQKKSDMKNRLAIFSKYSNALSISIHQNQYTDSRYSGAQMFYAKENDSGEKLAESMKRQFQLLLQPNNMRETKPVGSELYLLHNTKNPSVLVECGFLSNNDEAKKLESTDYQKNVAFTIMTGVFEYRIANK